MVAFSKLPLSFDVSELKNFLAHYDGWDKYPQRRTALGSPHSEMVDIWVRYKNPAENIESGDWSNFGDEHVSEWLEDIPQVKDICNQLMQYLDGEQLGGVLITKIPPNGKIAPHTDAGWHAEHYDKYYIPIKNSKGAKFCFESGEINPQDGECWAFRNDVTHWVENNSSGDRIAMIICIKQNKLNKGGVCLGDMQQQLLEQW